MGTVLGKPLSPGGGGAKIGVTLNEDDTQNLFITDNNTVLNLLVGTEDATATPADVASGKTFYARGEKKTGTAVSYEPVLLWTNPSPTESFAKQTITLNGDGYTGYIVEAKYTSTGDDKYRVRQYFDIGQISRPIFITPNNITYVYRVASNFTASGITFDRPSGTDSESRNTKYIIPTRIWGVKFTLN